jgi:hypothetical protein
MFKLDNYDGPNATLKGGIIDAVTGELVQTTIQTGSTLKFKELGWAEGGILTRTIMESGEYQDKLMFAGRYRLEFSECNFYPFVIDEIILDKGDNVRDFQVTPYIRVKNVNVRQEGDKIVATFSLQAGKPEVKLSRVQLYLSTDMYAGEPYTGFPLEGETFRQSFSPAVDIDDNTTYSLSIDLTNDSNKAYFKYKKNYYFRVGAMASVSGVGTIRCNYAPYTIINFNVL